jgi:hypothetical protein
MGKYTRGVLFLAIVALGLSSAGCSLSITVTCADGKKHWACPPPNTTLAAHSCHVVRQECLTSDDSGHCLTVTPTTFDAIACGDTAADACARFCVNGGLPTVPYTASCTSTPTSATVPTDPAYCNIEPLQLNYDLTCTTQGRECVTPSSAGCAQLSSTVTTGTFTKCEEGYSGPADQICGSVPDNANKAIFGARVTGATFKQHTGSCIASTALTINDMDYRLPSGTPVPVTIAGQNFTLMTSGGRMVVTYSCSGAASGGYSCTPSVLKDFWLGVNDTTIGGQTFNNITFTQLGPNPFQADMTLSPTGPGFRVGATISGLQGVTYVKPALPIKFAGSMSSTPFTLAGTFDLPIKWGTSTTGVATAHTTMNLAGSTFSAAGSSGGVQINCGYNSGIAPFVADTDFSGGSERTRANVIDLSGVINPAPMEVYQNQRFSSPFSYTIPGFASGSNHTVRLHFAETNPANNAAGKRRFSVAINGTTQISNLDLFATVGMNKAYIKEFTLPANSSGQYVLSFTASVDSATISAIEVL